MATARTSKADSSTTLSWSDGNLFQGYLLLGLAAPTGRPSVELSSYIGIVEIPIFTLIPITDGKYHQATEVFYTTDLTPPNTTYFAWLLDKTGTQVGSVSTSFTVTTNPFTPPSFTMTVPAVGTAPTTNF